MKSQQLIIYNSLHLDLEPAHHAIALVHFGCVEQTTFEENANSP